VSQSGKMKTNLLIVTSAACSAGCQTLKGTGAEFNASCQGDLMWLSPPARAGIVKLSGAGNGAQNSTAGCPSCCPHSRNIAPDATGGGKHPPSSPKGLCACMVCIRACVNSVVPYCCYCRSLTAHKSFETSPITDPTCVQGQGTADWTLLGF